VTRTAVLEDDRLETDVHSTSSADLNNDEEILPGPLGSNIRISSAISRELIYIFLHTAAIMASFLFGVCIVRG
jgi:hypothetical protein